MVKFEPNWIFFHTSSATIIIPYFIGEGELKLKQIKGMLFLLGAFILAGTSVIAARFVTGKLGAFTITAVSLFFALLSLLPFSAKKLKSAILQMSMRNWGFIFMQALFGVFLYRMFLLFGLLRTSSVEAGILTGATPAVTAILARLLLRETTDRKKQCGILCTIGGIFLVQGLLLPDSKFLVDHLRGNLLVLCAAVCESLFNTCSRIVVVKNQLDGSRQIPPVVQTTLVSTVALVFCIVPALFEHPVQSLSHAGAREWAALIWYGVFITALAFLFWYEGIWCCSVSTAAAFSGMVPFTSLTLSVLLLGEKTHWNQWLGGLFIILGMVLIGTRGSSSDKIRGSRKELVNENV